MTGSLCIVDTIRSLLVQYERPAIAHTTIGLRREHWVLRPRLCRAMSIKLSELRPYLRVLLPLHHKLQKSLQANPQFPNNPQTQTPSQWQPTPPPEPSVRNARRWRGIRPSHEQPLTRNSCSQPRAPRAYLCLHDHEPPRPPSLCLHGHVRGASAIIDMEREMDRTVRLGSRNPGVVSRPWASWEMIGSSEPLIDLDWARRLESSSY